MPQYLVCNYLPDDFDPSTVTEAMMEEIHALNRELIAAGARKFACGISPAANAKTLRKQRHFDRWGKCSFTTYRAWFWLMNIVLSSRQSTQEKGDGCWKVSACRRDCN
jgi:hypothetical protein